MKRYRSNDVKPGKGIDANKGASFTDNAQDPWTIRNPAGDERRYDRNAGSSGGDQWIERSPQNLLRNKDEFVYSAGKRDLWDDVDGNSVGTNIGFSGPVRYGQNRSQADGTVKSSR